MVSNENTAAPPPLSSRPRHTCEQCVNLSHQLKIKDTEIRARDTQISYLQGQLLDVKDKLLAKDSQMEDTFVKLNQKQEELLQLHAKFTQVLLDKDSHIQYLHQKVGKKQEDLLEKESTINNLLEKLNLRQEELAEKDTKIQEIHEKLIHMSGHAGTMKTGKNENNKLERSWRQESADNEGARKKPNKNMEVSWRANGSARSLETAVLDKILVSELEPSMNQDEIARAFNNQFKGAKVSVEVPQGKSNGIITVESEEKLQEALTRGILRVHGKPLELKRYLPSS
ncbi:1910_t:CDS:2 [Ambispora leptoticha]|uniref:1910_t:CDS:1 n=1 Tax=Ambispora leptoticha TaxID=144679 RepID=A0A9N9BTA8_9GLOM|nr:1910_t:CDS:2 [Ambispora leptoticha]